MIERAQLSDEEFLEAFEHEAIPASQFRHRDHLRMAWLYVTRQGEVAAEELASAGIRKFAAAHGVPQKYHHTVTIAWVRLVALHQRRWPAEDFDRFIEGSADLLDKRLLRGHFRSQTLASPRAREEWVEPDLAPLPN
jgi:hypothetical protein